MPWLKLKTAYTHYDPSGVKHLSPGDWVEVGKQQATILISDGTAETPASTAVIREALSDAGIIALKPEQIKTLTTIAEPIGLKVSVPTDSLPYRKNLFWDLSVPLDRGLLPIGFYELDRWEVACPLFSYEQLAIHTGSERDKELTKKVVRDLRVPLYNSGLIYIRACQAGERLLSEWRKQKELGDDPKMALLRAIYTVKPLLLPLPVTWTDPAYDSRVTD